MPWCPSKKKWDACVANSFSGTGFPLCTACVRPWAWPRNVVYAHMPMDLPEVYPKHTETVVTYVTAMPGTQPPRPSIVLDLFNNVVFAHSQPLSSSYRLGSISNRLVSEFTYNKRNGNAFCDGDWQDGGEYGYARLVTLNSWWNSLFMTLIQVAGVVIALQSDFMYIMSTFDSQPLEYSCSFLAAFGLTLFISILIAMREANKSWSIDSSARVGDLVTSCNGVDIWTAYAALVSFIFFGLEAHVTHVVTQLHPWKSVQPFAAFKSEGHRAFVIGYKDKQLFRVENQKGQFYTIPIFLIGRLAMSIMKLFALVFIEFDWVLLTAFVAGVPSLILSSFDLMCLYADRRSLKSRLLNMVTQRADPDNDNTAREKEACAKLLKLHFGMDIELRRLSAEKIDMKHCQSAVSRDSHDELGSGLVSSSRCNQCGRKSYRAHHESECLAVGQSVSLVSWSHEIDDASRGPLCLGEIGEVTEIGPSIPKLGRNVRVRALGGNTWWYNQSALQKAAVQDVFTGDDMARKIITSDKEKGGRQWFVAESQNGLQRFNSPSTDVRSQAAESSNENLSDMHECHENIEEQMQQWSAQISMECTGVFTKPMMDRIKITAQRRTFE